jgi:hypothetical protein
MWHCSLAGGDRRFGEPYAFIVRVDSEVDAASSSETVGIDLTVALCICVTTQKTSI